MGLSNQGAGADPGRSRQSTEQALLAASALAIPLGAACAAWASSHPQSCSVPESSRSFRLPLPTHPGWTSSSGLAGVSGELRWEGKLYVFNP